MSVFYDLSKTPRNILNQEIVRAIISENNGAWFDPSDMSTMFQDAAGTIPVTEVEQPVGKMLNKSGNGYHATQSITASRPTLSARYNLLLNSATLSTQNVTTIAAKYTLSFTGTGTVGLSGAATGSLVGTSVSDRVSLTFIPTAGTLTLTVTGSVTLAMLNIGTSAMTYQAITTATSYDSSPSLFPWFLRFDGIDDSMVYDSPYASSNNPSTHIIGVASRGLSTNMGFLTINPTAATTGTQRSISINSASTVKADCRNYPVAISTVPDIANIHVFSASFGGTKRAAISVDGGAYTTAVYGAPNTTSTYTAIGKGITNSITAFNFYGSISVGADLTEHQRHICERYLGRKAGVQL